MKTHTNNLTLTVLATMSIVLATTAHPAMAVERQWGGGSGGAGAGSWTDNTKWTGDTLPGSVDSAMISANGSIVTLSDGSTRTPQLIRIADEFSNRTAELNVTSNSTISFPAGFGPLGIGGGTNNVGTLNMSGNSTITGLNTDSNWGNGSGAVANVNLNNSHIIYTGGGGDGYRWGLSGGTANVNLENGSSIRTTSRELKIGFQVAGGKADIAMDATSWMDVGSDLKLAGSNPSFPGDGFTPAGYAVYNLPLTTTTASTPGKIYVGGGFTVGFDLFAPGTVGDVKAELRVTAPGSTYAASGGNYLFTGNTASDTSLNYHSRNLYVAATDRVQARMVIDGVDITNIQSFQIGNNTDSEGFLFVKDATLTKNSVFEWIRFAGGNNSKAQVVLDDGHLDVELGPSGAPVDIRHNSTGSAEVRGSGSITFGVSNFRLDGRLVADGDDLDIIKGVSGTGIFTSQNPFKHAILGQCGVLDEQESLGIGVVAYLDIIKGVSGTGIFTSQNFALSQSTYGQAGLYAVNGGKLTLPGLSSIGTGKTWGDDPNDTNAGGNLLVNAVRFQNVDNVAGTLLGSLYASDHGDVPAGLINPIGIWDFNDLTFDSAELFIRYDDVAAGANEGNMKLWHHNGSAWLDITGTLDTVANTMLSDEITSLSFFAIAEDAENPSAVPEPSTYALGLVGLAGLGLTAWRKRRRG